MMFREALCHEVVPGAPLVKRSDAPSWRFVVRVGTVKVMASPAEKMPVSLGSLAFPKSDCTARAGA